MSHVLSLQLSLADVARLAGVQRPVVSMWRRREIAGHPFPRPVAVVGGTERFDAEEVAAYLEATARGLNAEARDDLAAHASLAGVTALDETVAFEGLTALLCLAAITDEALCELGPGALVTLAEQADPHDSLLLREVRALGDDLPALAAHADALADAAYSQRGAFERLLHQQVHRGLPGHAATALQPDATSLVAQIARVLASDAGMESPLIVDVTDGAGDLLLGITHLYAAGSPPSVATVALDSHVARLTRRRLRVHDLHRLDVHVDESGGFTIPVPADEVVHMVQLPPAGRPSMTHLEILGAVDDLVVQMNDHQRAVVIGPASALTDRPASREADRVRDAILRTDRVRAVVRLPKGLLVRSPRQALGLWVLGPAHPDVARADRLTAIADLTELAVTEAVIDNLVTDIVAALRPNLRALKAGHSLGLDIDDSDQVRGHRFRYARRVPTAAILPGRRALVDKPTSRRADTTTPEAAAAIAALAQTLAPAPIANLRIEAGTRVDVEAPDRRTLADAVASRHCRIVPGNRLDPTDLQHNTGGRVVFGPSELLGERRIGERRIDLLTFAGGYPSGRFTEPGDVVFCTSPRVAARVDHDGGSVVVAPAKVLRITPTGDETLLPDVIAANIATQASPSKDWRRWPIRDIPRGQREHLAAALAEIERERAEALERVARLDALATALRDGVLAGSLAISSAPRRHHDPPKPAQSPDVSMSDMPEREGS